MKRLFSSLLAILCMFTMVAVIGCNDNGYSYWQVNKLVDSNDQDDVMTQYLEVSLKENNMKEFWINISSLPIEETTLGYVFGSSTNLKKQTIKRTFLSASDGWFKITASGTSKTFKITFVDEMRVNEIVFINEDDKVMEFEFVSYVVRPSFTSGQNLTVTKAELEEKNEKNSPLCAFDEQDKFDLSYAKEVFKKAEDLNKDSDSEN